MRNILKRHLLLAFGNLLIDALEDWNQLIDEWPTVMGEAIAKYTEGLYIRNQTLFVHLTIPALRAELSMQRKEIVKKLNEQVGSQVIADIRFN